MFHDIVRFGGDKPAYSLHRANPLTVLGRIGE
jgi:hypothetical protein